MSSSGLGAVGEMMGQPCGEGIQGKVATVAQVVANLSLFVIACVVSAGGMAPVTAGWCYFGLAGAGLALELAKGGKLSERKIKILVHAVVAITIMGVGLAGGLGALTTCKQLAWGYWGTALSILGLACCGGSSVGIGALVMGVNPSSR
ncbi:MAG: hypothetical protein K940chlam9_00055 [Chlamydiae bacterium]|nr:hypothetical protein [Chlamydiota bacterium]